MSAWWRLLREYVFPGSEEQDESFRREILRQSRLGLGVIGGIQIGVSLFMLTVLFLLNPSSVRFAFRLKEGAILIALGLINLALSRWRPVEPWARRAAALSGLATAAVLIWASLLALPQTSKPEDFIPGQMTLVMLVGITTIPLLPVHAFALGISIGAIYLASSVVAQQRFYAGTGPNESYAFFILTLSLLSTGITAILYRQRRAAFELREAQAQMMLAENATSMVRLAAALSHELNTPLGALLSGVDTLLLLTSKQATCTPAEQQRLVLLQNDIRKSIQQSAGRLRSLVTRMQRFTNLDQAEVREADLNELLNDVAAILRGQLPEDAHLELDLQPLPLVKCRPQQISAVFTSLVQNAVQALVDRGGRVRIASRALPAAVEIEISDSGRGMDPRELEGIFDPGFKVTGQRVRSSNWSMFTSRQIIREHGGDIRISSGAGAGTKVLVRLPAKAHAASGV